MTFKARDESLENGQPIRLYEFSRGPLRWLYSSADRDTVRANKVFRGNSGISDSGIQFSGQATADTLTITLPAEAEIAGVYRVMAPSDSVYLTIWDTHYEEEEYVVVWVGQIQGVKYPRPSAAEITCCSINASLDQPGLRLGWQRACPYTLYDMNCRVNLELYRVTTVVAAVTAQTITVPVGDDYPDDYFAGGFVMWDVGQGVMERRGIRRHTGETLLLLGSAYGLVPGQAIAIFPGCVRTTTVCSVKFDNIVNFGGQPSLPGKSPFDGTPVF